MAYPLEQGLKLILGRDTRHGGGIVLMAYPLEQGLKPYVHCRISGVGRPS